MDGLSTDASMISTITDIASGIGASAIANSASLGDSDRESLLRQLWEIIVQLISFIDYLPESAQLSIYSTLESLRKLVVEESEAAFVNTSGLYSAETIDTSTLVPAGTTELEAVASGDLSGVKLVVAN